MYVLVIAWSVSVKGLRWYIGCQAASGQKGIPYDLYAWHMFSAELAVDTILPARKLVCMFLSGVLWGQWCEVLNIAACPYACCLGNTLSSHCVY